MNTQKQKTLEEKMKILKELQNPYVDIIRQKIGEFMLIYNDLEKKRGIKFESQFNEVTNKEVDDTKSIKDIATKIITRSPNISTRDWVTHTRIQLLSTLLYNNGFPCQIVVKTLIKSQNQTERKFPKDENLGDVVYKMPMVYAGAEGEPVDTTAVINENTNETQYPNHYTFIIPADMESKITIPDNLNQILTDDMKETKDVNQDESKIMTKYKTSTDGHCFYRAVANWFIIYGITTDHLKNMTYNVPFDFSEEHFKQNLKVPNPTDANSIPEPISLPNSDDFKKIAENMKNKIQSTDFNPTFEDTFKNIKESKEYEEYDGITKDNETHCNKYKGNIEQ